MKNNILSGLFIVLLTSSLYAQDQQEQSTNFSLRINFGIGNSLLNSQDFKNLNGSNYSAQLNVAYDLYSEKADFLNWRFSLGLEGTNYNANLFSELEQSNLRADYLRVLIMVAAVYRLGRGEDTMFSNTKFIAGIGGFLNYVYKYEVSTIESTTDLDDVDLSFGYIFNLGIEQDVSQRYAILLGLDYSLMGEKNKRDQLNFTTPAFYIGLRRRL